MNRHTKLMYTTAALDISPVYIHAYIHIYREIRVPRIGFPYNRYICICMNMYVHIHICINVCVYSEREREREKYSSELELI